MLNAAFEALSRIPSPKSNVQPNKASIEEGDKTLYWVAVLNPVTIIGIYIYIEINRVSPM